MMLNGVSPLTYAVRGLLLIAAAAIALFNGSLWSPFFDSVAYILYLTTRGVPLMTAARASDATQIVIAVMTLMLAGIPAAVYERIRGLRTSTTVSIGIWLVATLLLTLPTIMNATADRYAVVSPVIPAAAVALKRDRAERLPRAWPVVADPGQSRLRLGFRDDG